MISQVVEVLLQDWYPSSRAHVVINCSACETPHFTRSQCCDAMAQSRQYPATLSCPTKETNVIVEDIAPDLALADIYQSSLLFTDEDLDFSCEDESEKAKGDEGGRLELGKGGYGVVYQARLRTSGNKRKRTMVAVKEISQADGNEKELSEFYQEAWMMRFGNFISILEHN